MAEQNADDDGDYSYVCFQSHLLSVFDNIRYVTFEEKMYDKIVAIISQEGENVPLQEHVMAVVTATALLSFITPKQHIKDTRKQHTIQKRDSKNSTVCHMDRQIIYTALSTIFV